MIPYAEQISQACKHLKLSQHLARRSVEQGDEHHLKFLSELLQSELEQRQANRIQRNMSIAGFPTRKTWDAFDFSHVELPPLLSQDDLAQLNFIEEKQNLIHFGPVGTGKTHLAIALGLMACQKNYRVRFYTVTKLVLLLGEAHRNGTLEKTIDSLQRLDLLLLDEWGYVPLDRQGSQLLFRVIADSYEQRSLILTTNVEFSRWGSIFTDQQMAAAMIDRLVHHGHLLVFDGPSHRMEYALMKAGNRRENKKYPDKDPLPSKASNLSQNGYETTGQL